MEKAEQMKVIRITDHPGREMPDQEVVSRIIKGEKEWFEVLMRRYNQSLYRAVRSYLRDEADVEDVMQDAYIKAYQNLEQFRGDSSFSTWLIRVGVNEALQLIRKRKRQPLAPGETTEWNDRIYELSPLNIMDPEKKAIQAETRLMIETAIDQLPEKYRVVYILKEVEGMKNPAIALALNISESNVKVRSHRGRNLLKEQLLKMSLSAELFEFGNNRCDRLVTRVMSRI